jgi:hypothetical protein
LGKCADLPLRGVLGSGGRLMQFEQLGHRDHGAGGQHIVNAV